MADNEKLARLLDDPEVRVMVYGLAHVTPVTNEKDSGAARLRAAVSGLAGPVGPDHYQGWLSDDRPNDAVTPDQVRATFGEPLLADLARYVGSDPGQVTSQLASVLPDLVDAMSPGGHLIPADDLARELSEAAGASDSSAGPFGPHVH